MKKSVALNKLHNMYERKQVELNGLRDEKQLSIGKLDNYRNNIELIEKELVKYKIKQLLSLKGRLIKKDVKYSSSYELLTERVNYLKELLSSATERMSLVVAEVDAFDEKIELLYNDIKTISYYKEKLKERIIYERLFHKATDELDDLEIVSYISNYVLISSGLVEDENVKKLRKNN